MTVHPLRVPLASVQGTLALDLNPLRTPPELPGAGDRVGALADVVAIAPDVRGHLDRWAHRYVQAAVEIVGGDRPVTQLLSWTTRAVYADLHRRAMLVARAGGHQPGVRRVQPVRPQVVSVHTSFVSPHAAEATARIRYGERSRALALRFERREDRWVCCAMEFA